jgi:1-acyl-sn-glycerol-3-phosphate acyltransferase
MNLLRAVLQAYCQPYVVVGEPPRSGPLIIVANHASHLDAPAIVAALPEPVRHRIAVAAAEDYFFSRRLLGLLVTLGIGAFPFPRHGDVGLQRAAALLDAGRSVLLFPEGSRSSDGQPHRFRGGIGRLAAATRAPVLPVGVVGSHALWPRGHRLPRRGRLEVRLGEPWQPHGVLSPEEICAEVQRRVCALLGDNQ